MSDSRRTIENIKTILEAAGAGLEDVVKCSVFSIVKSGVVNPFGIDSLTTGTLRNFLRSSVLF